VDVRKVVTGLDAQGHATVTADGPIGQGMTLPDVPGWEITLVGSTPAGLELPRGSDPPAINAGVGPGATQFHIWRLPPVEVGPNPAGAHTTDTVDYIVILDGGVSMVMADGREVELHRGDCVVQNGTRHEWVNRTGHDCLMAVFMVGGRRA
jgi:mannose-6-phosphate isomerase-like protein (cupin superfamily)